MPLDTSQGRINSSGGVAGAAAGAALATPLKRNISMAIAAAVAICLLLEKTPVVGPAGHKTADSA